MKTKLERIFRRYEVDLKLILEQLRAIGVRGVTNSFGREESAG